MDDRGTDSLCHTRTRSQHTLIVRDPLETLLPLPKIRRSQHTGADHEGSIRVAGGARSTKTIAAPVDVTTGELTLAYSGPSNPGATGMRAASVTVRRGCPR